MQPGDPSDQQAPMTDPPAGERDAHPGMPRWVKAAIAVVLVLVAILVIGKLAGVEHGPGMHGGSAQPPAAVSDEAGGHKPPPGVDHGQP